MAVSSSSFNFQRSFLSDDVMTKWKKRRRLTVEAGPSSHLPPPSTRRETGCNQSSGVKSHSCPWLACCECKTSLGVVWNILKLANLYETSQLGLIVDVVSLHGESQQSAEFQLHCLCTAWTSAQGTSVLLWEFLSFLTKYSGSFRVWKLLDNNFPITLVRFMKPTRRKLKVLCQ